VRALLRSLPLVVAVLAIPIVPFLLWGGTLEEWFDQWRAAARDPWRAAALIIGLLSTDIFLPIPSSLVSTFGGAQLGWLGGTLASWIGMSVGAIAGFALARWLGPAFARRLTSAESLEQMRLLTEKHGPGVVILTRGLPVLAEASVLLLGAQRMAWSKFLPPLLLSNFGLSVVYAVFGQVSETYDATPLALAVSILLPVLVAAVVQWRLRAARPLHPVDPDEPGA
jgi:uncharacterized membrane protein YdjX (TVP38/TMEM64 family)